MDIILYAEDFEFDAESDRQIQSNNQTKTMVGTLTNWIAEQPEDLSELTASRRLHLHFLHSPVEIYDGADAPGRVAGIKFERTELDGTGNARGTGEFVDYPVQAVYRAIGYFGSALPEVEFDHSKGVVPNDGGRVLDAAGTHVPGIYATGWIKRGPVGLIGHTKGDALETVTYLLEDRENLPLAAAPAPEAIVELLEGRGVEYTSWEGWLALDEHERALGEKATAAGAVARRRRPARAHQGGAPRGHGGDLPRRRRRGLDAVHADQHRATRGHFAPIPDRKMGREVAPRCFG